MSDWDSYVRDDVQQGGGEGWETVPEDVYDAVCIEVGEPYERDTQFGTKMKFVVRWRISGGDLDGDVEIPQFVTLSDKLISDGFISEKSWIWKIMQALGYDMTQAIRFDPRDWVGKRCRITIKNQVDKDGVETSWVDSLMQARRREPVAAGAARKPVAAGARRPQPRPDPWEQEEDAPFE